ncbi:hypothetical protein [Variovorax fucosicus]|uniref:hypothetical protein n=1 Tax=Variovorax fucosicus TaxID=3053517 RepID=UPI0033658700
MSTPSADLPFVAAARERERAKLRERQPEVFSRLQRQWVEWDSGFLPITDEVFTHGVTPDIQADRYVPHSRRRIAPGEGTES